SQVAQQLLRPGVYLALLGCAVWLSQGLDPQRALALHAVAAVLATIFALARSGSRIARLPLEGTSGSPRAILMASLPFLLLASIQILNYQVVLVVVGMKFDTADIGIYRTAMQIADALGVVLFAFSTALGPRIVQLQTQGRFHALKRLLVRSHLAAIAVMLPLAGGVALFAEQIISLIFGAEYAEGAAPLAILAIGKILYAGVAFSGLGLSMLGRPGRTTVALSTGLVLNVALVFALIPAFGLQGAAWATVLAAFAGNLLAAFYLYTDIWRKTSRQDQRI
ncbi:MAG: polysaccharide biosynthesis C-terminal domain-containing protein, partial [Xanthomonadales bacterium]|nr:polysaccharide biosynthesis C-terminal domain-containing protein [Xanthomonadales bacterium]